MYLSVNKVAFVVIISESAIVAPASQFITMLVMNQNCICPSLRVGIVDIELCVLSLRESATVQCLKSRPKKTRFTL